MYSRRFGKAIIVTQHARARMAERNVDDSALLEVIETGDLTRADQNHLFLFKRLDGRRDNLICAAAVEESHLVIKTVMVNWVFRGQL
jgi:hypothetical protein